MFFDLISSSAPHIYISALPLSPQMSMVYRLYKQYACPSVRVVHGLPISWNPVVATVHKRYFGDQALWSPCNRFIAVITYDGADIHDAVTLNSLNTFKSRSISGGQYCYISPDSHTLIRLNSNTFDTWDLQTGGLVDSVYLEWVPKGFPLSATYSMDGKAFAVIYSNFHRTETYIVTHIFSTACTQLHIPEGHILDQTWTQGEFFQYATMKPGYITIWKAEFTLTHPPEVVELLSIPDNIDNFANTQEFLFLPTLSQLAISLQDTLLVWDAKDSKPLLKISPYDTEEMTFSPNGHFFASTFRGTKEVHVWKESSDGYILHQTLAFPNLMKPLLSPDGKSIAAFCYSTLHLWHTKDPIPPSGSASPIDQNVFILGFSPNKTLAAFACHKGSTVIILDLQSGEPQFKIDAEIEVGCLGVTDSTLVVANKEKILTWNLAIGDTKETTNKSVQVMTFDCSPPSCVRGSFFSMSVLPDLSCIVTLGETADNNVMALELYNVSTGRCAASSTIGRGELNSPFPSH